MPLLIVERDIFSLNVDAIVNSTNAEMIGYSGVDKLIHEKAGAGLDKECRSYRWKLKPGQAIATGAYELSPVKHIIHTISPSRWDSGYSGEGAILKSCYTESLKLISSFSNCRSVAFPLIGSGNNDMPIDFAYHCTIESISEYLKLRRSNMMVYLTLHGRAAERIRSHKYPGLDKYIEEVRGIADSNAYLSADIERVQRIDNPLSTGSLIKEFMNEMPLKARHYYELAGWTKDYYYKILKNDNKKPSAEKLLKLAWKMQLSYNQALELLNSAGYVFNHNNPRDIILEFFFKEGVYDSQKLNAQLERFNVTDFYVL